MWRFVSMVFAERSEQSAKAGATLTPSTDQAQRTPKISSLDVRIRKPA